MCQKAILASKWYLEISLPEQDFTESDTSSDEEVIVEFDEAKYEYFMQVIQEVNDSSFVKLLREDEAKLYCGVKWQRETQALTWVAQYH